MELPDVTPTFDTWWSAYPRKQGKADAIKKFAKLSDVDKYNCLQGTVYQTEHNPQWQNPAFIPIPSTFINQRRWEDEIAENKDAKTRVVESADTSNAHTVWAAMVGIYGQQWIAKFGEKPDYYWSKFLQALPDVRIKRALRLTLERNPEFPPSLARFMEYSSKTFEESYPPALPKPYSDQKVALPALAEALEILGIKK